MEADVYREQSFASEFVESIGAELRRRCARLGTGYPIDLLPTGAFRATPGAPSEALRFCLLLSVGTRYSDWSKQFDSDYSEQGELFERVVADALQFWFPSWNVVRTGWGDGNQLALEDLVSEVAQVTCEDVIEGWEDYVRAQAKDLGLDVAVVRSFGDSFGGVPAMMFQCASGEDWPTKLSTPDTKAWNRVISLTHTPLRGFSTPVVIPLDEVRSRRNQAHGVLLDRYRLLPPVPELDWLEDATGRSIAEWSNARTEWLQQRFALYS